MLECVVVLLLCTYTHTHSLQTFNNWIDNTLDDLQEALNTTSSAEVEAVVKEHEEFKAGALQLGSSDYDELSALVQQMADLGSSDNPYTTLTAQVGTPAFSN